MDKLSINTDKSEEVTSTFKKPVLIGKIGRLPRKTPPVISKSVEDEPKAVEIQKEIAEEEKNNITEVAKNEEEKVAEAEEPISKEPSAVLNYVEPTWSGLPESSVEYCFEVLKSGVIIEKINLMEKPYWTFGRLIDCDIYMAHPTISRYHAVLQYKTDNSPDRPAGFYIYDLGSTHGTFLNKNRIKPKLYVRVQVGHMLKLGCSTRSYLLVGPEEDIEEETKETVTELKEKRAQELKQREEAELRKAAELEELKKKEEERGIDWGMGEDADEETDIQINPFAETNNEELYLDDPKKTLRGFMEREGVELNYEVSERGVGQFLCSVVLPIDDARGRSIIAEALVKGKKKEAVVQCALEACRILDRHGVLRQATHESKKRKERNWEENDYYDSDEDTFLDRTGTIERKREKRMKSKQPQQPETYQTLVSKEENLLKQIQDIQKQISNYNSAKSKKSSGDSDDLDSLDQYMNELSSNKPDKYLIGKLKTELVRLRSEHGEILRLVNIARPAHLPPLNPLKSPQDVPSTSGSQNKPKALPIFGKRLKVKVTLPQRSETENIDDNEEEDEVKTSEKLPSNEEMLKQLKEQMISDTAKLTSLNNNVKARLDKTKTKIRKLAEKEEKIVVDEKRLVVQEKKICDQLWATDSNDIEKNLKLSNALSKTTNEFNTIGNEKLKIVDKIHKITNYVKNIAVDLEVVDKASNDFKIDRMKSLFAIAHKQQTEIFKQFTKFATTEPDPEVVKKLTELFEWLDNRKMKMLDNLEKLKTAEESQKSELLKEIKNFEKKWNEFVTTILEELKKMGKKHENYDPSQSVAKLLKLGESSSEDSESESAVEIERKRKKNMRRIMQRQEKQEAEKKKQYEEDSQKEDYNMWVPPKDQTGDGRTSLNDKLGY